MLFAEASNRVGPFQVNLARLVIGGVFLTLTIIIGGISISITSAQIMYLALSGFVGLSFGDTFLFKAMREIGARLSMLLMSSVPIFSAIISWIVFREGLGVWEFIGMALTIAGIALVIMRRTSALETRHHVNLKGVLYGLLGALGQAGGLILAKQAFLIAPVNSFTATLIRIGASLIILLPLAMATGRVARPVHAFRKDRKALVLTMLGSFVGPYLGITFSLIAISNANVGVASTIMATVPIIMLPMVHFIYHERLTWQAYAGAVLAVAGTAVLFLV